MVNSVATRYVEEKLVKLLQKVGIKLEQKAKVPEVVQGYNNTHFFHLIANSKHKRKKFHLEQDDGTI